MALWPTSGLLLGFLLLDRIRNYAWFLLVGLVGWILFALLHPGQGIVPALVLLCANAILALIAVWLLHQFSRPPFSFRTVRQVFVLFGVAAVASVASSAFGVVSFWFMDAMQAPILAGALWWIADLLGVLLVTPLLVSWLAPQDAALASASPSPRFHMMEAAALTLGLGGISWLVFTNPFRAVPGVPIYPFLTIPFLFWGAVRFGTRGASAATCVLAVIAVFFTSRGTGPFALGDGKAWYETVILEVFLCVSAMSALLLAATTHERLSQQDEIRKLNATLEARVERRTAELRASEQRYQTLAATSPVGILHCDAEGIARYANDRWGEIIGKPAEHCVGRSWLADVHPEDIGVASAKWKEARNGGRSFATEFRCRTPNGDVRWVFGQFARERGPRGELLGFVGTVTDISERKEAERELKLAHDKLEERVYQRTRELSAANQQLKDGEKRIRRVIDSAYDAFIGVDNCGIINDWNPQATAVFGWSRVEAIGRSALDTIVPALGGEPFAHRIQHFLATKDGHALEQMEVTAARRDGSSFPAELTISSVADGDARFFSMFVRDITERKDAEKALRESESVLRSFFDSAPLMLGIVEVEDCDVVFRSVNAAVGRYFGEEPSELVNRRLGNLAPGSRSLELWVEHFRESEQLGHPVQFQFQEENGHGPRELSATVCHAMTTPEGVPRYAFVVEDITERRESQQELGEKTIALENAAEGIARVDSQGRYLSVNRAYGEGIGRQEHDLIGQEWLQTIHPNDREEMKVAYQTMLAQGKAEVEARALRADGQVAYRQQMMVSTYDQEGQFVGHYNFVRDITERKRAEEERDRFFTLSLDMLCITNSNGYFRRLNPAFERTLGFSLAELMATPFISFIHPEDRKATSDVFRQLAEGLPCVNFENRCRCRDGSYRWLSWTASPFVAEGIFYAVARDVTEEKENAASLMASLEEKEVLLKEIHHRVKNNLQVISSLLQLQSGYIKDEGMLETFRESQNRIRSMSIIHERLYQTESFANIDFAEYANDLLSMLMRSYAAQPGEVRLVTDIDGIALGINVAVPVGLITNEVISNSLKYAFPDRRRGTVTVTLRKVPGGGCELSIRDDGVGMRMAEGVSPENASTLGLRLINILTKQIGGEFAFSSNSGGTQFTLKLPAA